MAAAEEDEFAGFVVYDDSDDEEEEEEEEDSGGEAEAADAPDAGAGLASSSQRAPGASAAATGSAGAAAAAAGQPVTVTPLKKRGRKRARDSDSSKQLSRKYQAQLEKDLNLPAEVAEACGLHPFGLNEHEQGLLADDLDEELYFEIRNRLLALWRGDVSKYISLEAAAARVRPANRRLAEVAWHFLDSEGFINWGVAPAITDRPAVTQQPGTVLILGAGLAGLSAARQLRNHGHKVLVLEGADRPGGRVHTHRLEGANGEAAVADLGGSIITGIHSNPLAVLARQLDIPLHDISTKDVPLYLQDGSLLDPKVDKEGTMQFDQMLDRSAALREQMPSTTAVSLQAALTGLWQRAMAAVSSHVQQQPQQQQQTGSGGGAQQQRGSSGGGAADSSKAGEGQRRLFINWHMANIEFANAARMCDLSMRHWDLDDVYEHQGAHVFLPGGNLRLLQGLAKDIPIVYNTPARLVQYSSQGVRVHTADGRVYEADAVVVTVPLGVLKRPDGLQFSPPLPPRKQLAIKRLGFGCLNKVMLLFPHCFWGDRDMFGHINPDTSQRGMSFLFYAYHGISGGAVLAALIAGDAALAVEQLGQEAAVGQVMDLLRSIFTPQGVDVPEPLQAVLTRWASDPMAFGSYSSVAVGSTGPTDYEVMSRPLGSRVFFAGEATSTKYPATMHGAFATGMREAANVMAALTKLRGDMVRPQGQGVPPEADQAEADKAHQTEVVARALQQVFADAPRGGRDADVDVGVLRAVYGPDGSGLEDTALVQIQLEDEEQQDPAAGAAAAQQHGGGSSSSQVVVYAVLSRPQLEELAEGGADLLCNPLVRRLGCALLGRPLSAAGLSLLEAICQDRGLGDEVVGLESVVVAPA